jgi:hypothetical protein
VDHLKPLVGTSLDLVSTEDDEPPCSETTPLSEQLSIAAITMKTKTALEFVRKTTEDSFFVNHI